MKKKNPLANVPIKSKTVKIVYLNKKKWVILWEHKDFEPCESAEAALRKIEAVDNSAMRAAQRKGKSLMLVTQIEWCGTPKGFKAPK